MAETPNKLQPHDPEVIATGEPCDYIIHPQPDLTEEELSEMDTAIREIAGPDGAIERTMATGAHPPQLSFWLGLLTERLAGEIRKLAGVCDGP